jgi:hypothetical protein
LSALLLVGCTPTARTRGPYEAKAVRAAESVRSSVASDLLVLAAVARRNTTAAYVSVATSRAEDDAAAAASTFASIQPPDDVTTRLRGGLTDLLDEAVSALGETRIAGRRGDHAALLASRDGLADAARRLDAFLRSHR